MHYPVLEYPAKVNSLSLDTTIFRKTYWNKRAIFTFEDGCFQHSGSEGYVVTKVYLIIYIHLKNKKYFNGWLLLYSPKKREPQMLKFPPLRETILDQILIGNSVCMNYFFHKGPH
jgi:hypothetical protein